MDDWSAGPTRLPAGTMHRKLMLVVAVYERWVVSDSNRRCLMNGRFGLGVAFLAVVSLFCLGVPGSCLGAPEGASAQKAKTGSIKGEITVRGVRSPENVLVYIEKAPGTYKPPAKPVEMDQKKIMFVPHVLPIVKGTTVVFRNSDPLLHNVFWPASKEGPYPSNNLGTWGQGASRTFTFEREGHVVLLCNIHPEMEGHIVILQNPFFAIAGKDGLYEIKDVPAGRYTVKTWYPEPRKLKSKSSEATVEAGKAAKLDFSLSR
jgi:plastocyanin